jgi:hypothetical protein
VLHPYFTNTGLQPVPTARFQRITATTDLGRTANTAVFRTRSTIS